MIKVALITNIPSPYRVDLFYYMQTHLKEYEIHVIYTNQSEDNRKWKIENEKLINSHILNSKIIKLKGELDDRYIHFPGNIGRILSRLKIDVVIAWEYNLAAIQSMIWCKIKKKPFIHLTDGTLYSERNIGNLQKISRKLITQNADACIASSSKAKEKLMRWSVPEEKIFISLLTVDITKIRKTEHKPESGRLLYVGSMIQRKGLDLLLKALLYVVNDYLLHIVGNGNEKQIEELKKIAKDLGATDHIQFCGFKQGEELINEYQRAQAFILPTREDCFGLVLLEALCAEVPIISSKYADGAYDIVNEGKNGILVDPYDSKEFGSTINKVLKKEISLDGKEDMIVGKFTFDEVSKGYKNAIAYVLKGEK